MKDILLPRTDAGVTFQFVVATAILGLLLWRVWRNKDARIFVIGLWLLTYGAMGIRTIH